VGIEAQFYHEDGRGICVGKISVYPHTGLHCLIAQKTAIWKLSSVKEFLFSLAIIAINMCRTGWSVKMSGGNSLKTERESGRVAEG
jgi:hypothetical protein